MPTAKNTPAEDAFEYTTKAGVSITLPPLMPTFGQLRKIRKLSDFDQWATLVEWFVADEDILEKLDAIPAPEVQTLREEWFKHSNSPSLGE
ncbi:hypothetical protein [Rhodococcus jostii]|uniref:hypothetical protein n=1 Tax=Rhodococcus jostii TaxID=132919 RepID=UPI00365F0357